MTRIQKLKILITLTALFVMFLTAVEAQRPARPFTLNATVYGAPSDTVHLSYEDGSGKKVTDSAAVLDGRFSFKGNVSGPTIAYLYGDAYTGVQIYLEPSLMTLIADSGNFQKANISGSYSQKDADELSAMLDPIRLEMAPLSARYTAANEAYMQAKDSITDQAVLDSLKNVANAIHEEFEPFQGRIAQKHFQFFEQHPSSIVTAYNLRFYVSSLSLDSIRLFYNRMSPITRQTSYGKVIEDELKKVEAGSPGSMAKNFSAVTISLKRLALEDLKGKYVLLDFWASWCVPCRKENPHLKELYAKYKEKGFEVVGVSDDDRDVAAWKAAVAKDDLPWLHVLRGLKYDPDKGYDRTNDISELFGIHTLPTQVLIDPTGKIIARYGGNGQPHTELDGKLASLMQ